MTPDPDRCPLCGQPNACGVAGPGPCWCSLETVPAGLLDRIPPALRGKACVCRRCIATHVAATPTAPVTTD